MGRGIAGAATPWGLEGGAPGQTGRIEVHRQGAAPMMLTKQQMKLLAGDIVRVFTAGGGGFGPPEHRSATDIAADLAQGYISAAAAAADYKKPASTGQQESGTP